MRLLFNKSSPSTLWIEIEIIRVSLFAAQPVSEKSVCDQWNAQFQQVRFAKLTHRHKLQNNSVKKKNIEIKSGALLLLTVRRRKINVEFGFCAPPGLKSHSTENEKKRYTRSERTNSREKTETIFLKFEGEFVYDMICSFFFLCSIATNTSAVAYYFINSFNTNTHWYWSQSAETCEISTQSVSTLAFDSFDAIENVNNRLPKIFTIIESLCGRSSSPFALVSFASLVSRLQTACDRSAWAECSATICVCVCRFVYLLHSFIQSLNGVTVFGVDWQYQPKEIKLRSKIWWM